MVYQMVYLCSLQSTADRAHRNIMAATSLEIRNSDPELFFDHLNARQKNLLISILRSYNVEVEVQHIRRSRDDLLTRTVDFLKTLIARNARKFLRMQEAEIKNLDRITLLRGRAQTLYHFNAELRRLEYQVSEESNKMVIVAAESADALAIIKHKDPIEFFNC